MLASASPQRRAILEQLGLRFTVEAPDVEERVSGSPRELVVENALRKARAVTAERVIAADTVVMLDGHVLGKPADEGEARRFLGLLSDREHAVLSGIAVRDRGGERWGCALTRVWFRSLTCEDIESYLASCEWRGRAGAYAIQGRGAVLVESIEGDFLNVVGLPVAELVRLAPDLVR